MAAARPVDPGRPQNGNAMTTRDLRRRAHGGAPTGHAGRGMFWPWFVAVLLAATAVAQGIMLYAATHDPTFSIEPDYYRKAVAWDSVMARERASAALGWSAAATMVPAGGDAATLRLTIADRTGAPVTGAAATAVLVNNLDGNAHLRVSLTESSAGAYSAALGKRRSGLWEVRLDARRGDSRYVPTLRLEYQP